MVKWGIDLSDNVDGDDGNNSSGDDIKEEVELTVPPLEVLFPAKFPDYHDSPMAVYVSFGEWYGWEEDVMGYNDATLESIPIELFSFSSKRLCASFIIFYQVDTYILPDMRTIGALVSKNNNTPIDDCPPVALQILTLLLFK